MNGFVQHQSTDQKLIQIYLIIWSQGGDVDVIDVRELHEMPAVNEFQSY